MNIIKEDKIRLIYEGLQFPDKDLIFNARWLLWLNKENRTNSDSKYESSNEEVSEELLIK